MPAFKQSQFVNAIVESELAKLLTTTTLGNDRLGFMKGVEGKTLLVPADEEALNEFLQDVFKQKDYGTLFDGLEFLKFSKSTAKDIVGFVSTVASLVSVVGTVVAAVETAEKVFKLLGLADEAFDMEAAIREIGADVKKIYAYLEETEANEVYKTAEKVRSRLERMRNARDNTATSPSEQSRTELVRVAYELEEYIDTMLGFYSNRIPLSVSAHDGKTGSYLPLMGSIHLRYADGQPTPPNEGLATMVWDPGFYVDALAAALRLSVEINATLEPLFRSTGYRRDDFGTTAEKLRAFIKTWRSQIMVADPTAGVGPDGNLPLRWGILVGAVCPVTGMSSLSYYDSFPIQEVWAGSLFATGTPDSWRTPADPNSIKQQALTVHNHRLNQLIRACGLLDFERLLRQIEEIATAPSPTESVHFVPSSRFDLDVSRWLVRPEPVPVRIDLGSLARFSSYPDKTYEATRHAAEGVKVVRLLMGRRARQSLTRIGYQLRLGKRLVDLTTWEVAPEPERADVDWFPSQQISVDVEHEDDVYDCVQSRELTSAEEDSFDRGKGAGRAKRVFVNQRRGLVRYTLRVEFKPLANDEETAHLGEVTLTFTTPLYPDAKDAFVIDLDVLETHKAAGAPGVTEQTVVEGLNLHMVPSFMIAPADYFDDYLEARQRMLKAQIEAKLVDTRQRFDVSDIPRGVDPNPKFSAVVDAARIASSMETLRLAEREPGVAMAVKRHTIPSARRR